MVTFTNPVNGYGENESAQLFSSFLGDEEVRYKHKSRSSGGGKPSTTISEQEKVKKLLESSQFLKLPTGKCVFINPAYANTLEGSVPLFKKIHIPRYLKMIDKYNEQNWHKVVKMLTQTSTQRCPSPEDLSLRVVEINRRFPLINKDEANSNKQATNSVLTINEVNSILNSNSDVVVI